MEQIRERKGEKEPLFEARRLRPKRNKGQLTGEKRRGATGRPEGRRRGGSPRPAGGSGLGS